MKEKLLKALEKNEISSVTSFDFFTRNASKIMINELLKNMEDISFTSDLACVAMHDNESDLINWLNSHDDRLALYNSVDCYTENFDRLQNAQLLELEDLASEILEQADIELN